VKKKLGNRIRQYRLIRSFSQEKVADELKMSVGNYGKIERGDVSISVDTFLRICQILEIKPSQLLDEGEQLSHSNLSSFVTRSEFQILQKEFEVLSVKLENIMLRLDVNKGI
jgi:transcriptional regulator with XRE-family HTH domain